MLAQEPTTGPKCNLINSSFCTVPHLLDSLIWTKNTMSIVLLLQIMGDGIGGSVVDLY